MAKKRAKTFSDAEFTRLLRHIDKVSKVPVRDRLIAALSFTAGLRVGEIAKLKIDSMLTPSRKISDTIMVFSDTTKGSKRERSIAMSELVRECLIEFRKTFPGSEYVAFSSQPFQHMLARGEEIPKNARYKPMSPDALKHYYLSIIKSSGFVGASTHSGRRTFGTRAARLANLHHCSLKDVQLMLGHARLETTENYIEVSDDHRSLVNAILKPASRRAKSSSVAVPA